MATPLLTATPSEPPTYNPSMAETFSWVPVQGAGRPLFAQASYLVGGGDISIDVADIQVGTDEVEALVVQSNLKLDTINSLLSSQLGQTGFVAIQGGETASGADFSTVQVISACRISNITASNSTIGALTAFDLPAGFTFNGPITSITLSYGAAIVYKL